MIRQEGERLLLEGSVTIQNVEALLQEGVGLCQQGGFVVDLAGVEEADSSALALMLEWRRQAAGRGCQLRFENLPVGLISLATVYGVNDLLVPASPAA